MNCQIHVAVVVVVVVVAEEHFEPTISEGTNIAQESTNSTTTMATMKAFDLECSAAVVAVAVAVAAVA